jgi:tRNA U34 5-methylaminomethyl-2-thiouridine-forming methyltransferase MnmC
MDAGRTEGAEVVWRGQVPVSARFDDPYYSLEDGLAESRHVFLAGSCLPERFRPGFHVAELGFGTGLNALAAWAAWRAAGVPGDLRFTSFEAFPMAVGEMRRALAAWPEVAALAAVLPEGWHPGAGELALPGLRLRVITGDARARLPEWNGRADAWFLDGFGPAKNPELWEPALMAEVAAHTAPGGTFATYSAAGPVRRALAAAGFDVERVLGHGRKRHMTRGVLR